VRELVAGLAVLYLGGMVVLLLMNLAAAGWDLHPRKRDRIVRRVVAAVTVVVVVGAAAFAVGAWFVR
jgi:hypothetical protein